jgi:hypothetical protein
MNELQELQAKLEAANAATAKAEAKNEAAAAALAAVKAHAKTDLIAANRDKITPAMLASVESFASKCDDSAELRGFIASLPVQTNDEPVGAVPPQPDEKPKPSANEERLRQTWNMTDKTMAYAEVMSRNLDGTFNLADGRKVTDEQLNKGA